MTHINIRAVRRIAAALLCIAVTFPPAAPADQSNGSTTFSGRATVVEGTIAGIDLSLADTGPLDPGGGARENSLLCYPDGPDCQVGLPDLTNGAVSAKVLHASTVGRGERSRSKASVAEIAINVADVPIEAEFVSAIAEATCQAGVAAISGASKLVHLVVNGIPVVVTGEPNQEVSAGPVTLILNEQTGGATGATGDITVNALHVKVAEVRDPISGIVTIPGSDLIVAQAHADIRCGQPSCTFAEKVTGGGFVMLGAERVNFAVAGKNLSDWGHFLAINHGTREKLKATALMTTFDAEGFAVITGTAQVNGSGSYSFTVRVKDNGEPGSSDQFELSSNYATMNVPLTTISGGNIQFHKPCKGGP
jgi:hypothetical protein